MAPRTARSLTSLAPLAVLALAVALRIASPPGLEHLQLLTFDAFQRLHPRAYQDLPVKVVDLDEESLERLGQWPWPRTQVAELIRKLDELGAAVIALDIVFAEPDRTSPSRLVRLWTEMPVGSPLREAAETLPDHDAVLAEAMREAAVVTGFTLTVEPRPRLPAAKAGWSYAGDDPKLFARAFAGAVTTLPELEAAADGNGHFTLLREHDGIVRRVPVVLRLGDQLYPSLSAEAVRVAQGASAYAVKSSGASSETSFGAHTGMTHVKIGRVVVPVTADGFQWLHYTGPAPARVLPAWRVMEGEVGREALEGTIVLVGTSASGLKDLRATPLNPEEAGILIHAQAAEQMLSGEALVRPDWAPGAELLYLIALGLALILLLPRVGALWCALIALVTAAAAFGTSWYAFTRLHWLLDPVYPSLAVLLIYLVSSLLSYVRAESERREIRSAFGRYLSPALVERLADSPDRLALGGEIRPMTVLFADIRDFTTIAEQLDARELTRFMNRFFTPMTAVILEQGGTIDKYMGDCIMAFWNAPLDDPDHARHACRAALAMGGALARRNAELRDAGTALGREPIVIRLGIGVNTGECCVGNLGSDQRFDYSVIGDHVNLASRLEGRSKTYGVGIVIGEETRTQAPELAALELDVIRVKGKTAPARVFALLGDEALAGGDAFTALVGRHARMLAAYRSQAWEEARAALERARASGAARFGLAALYELYETRIARYAASSPGAGWDGVFTASEK